MLEIRGRASTDSLAALEATEPLKSTAASPGARRVSMPAGATCTITSAEAPPAKLAAELAARLPDPVELPPAELLLNEYSEGSAQPTALELSQVSVVHRWPSTTMASRCRGESPRRLPWILTTRPPAAGLEDGCSRGVG